jgi:hypothetical protein
VKYLKRINEGWSDDYVTDFSDNGFTIEETPSNIKGSISKGKFLVTDLNNWFTEMTDKLSDNYKVLSSKTFFNQTTGNANFEVVITETGLESIYINVDGTDIEFIPKTILYISHYTYENRHRIPLQEGNISIKGRLSTGLNKTLLISIKWKDDFKEISFSLSNKSRGVTMTKENMEKIFTLFDSGQVKFSNELSSNIFSSRRALEDLGIIRAKISE